jgi:surfeit locus 1 family protein
VTAARRLGASRLVTAAAIAFALLTAALGVWQLERAQVKEKLQAQYDRRAADAPIALGASLADPNAVIARRVTARGEYVERYTILLDNRTHRGRAGYHVVSPLRIGAGDMHVLVNRGWVAAGRTREELPAIAALPGERTIDGIATVPPVEPFALALDVAVGKVWQQLDLERYRAWSGLAIQPIVIQQTDESGDGLLRAWSRPDAGADRNRAYAVQWFAMAVLTVIIYFALSFRRHDSERG